MEIGEEAPDDKRRKEHIDLEIARLPVEEGGGDEHQGGREAAAGSTDLYHKCGKEEGSEQGEGCGGEPCRVLVPEKAERLFRQISCIVEKGRFLGIGGIVEMGDECVPVQLTDDLGKIALVRRPEIA